MLIPEFAGLLIRRDVIRCFIQPSENDIGVTSFCKCGHVGHAEYACGGNNLGLRLTIWLEMPFRPEG
jgi:hypothetical protein